MYKLTSLEVGFSLINIDECMFYLGGSIYILYTYDSFLEGPDEEELRQIISDIKVSVLDTNEEGDI